MAIVQRTVYIYHLELTLYKARNIDPNTTLYDEIHKVLKYIDTLAITERKKNFKRENKILYLESSKKDGKTKILNLRFVSAKYNQVREVIDTDTLKSKGKLKEKTDGDKEYNHVSLSFEDEKNATIAYEVNSNGIGMGRIIAYLDDMAEKYYASINNTKFYRFDSEIVPDDDFLKNLSKMSKINVATFLVDKKELNTSDFKDLAGRSDVRDEIAIVVKPKGKGLSILSKTIEDYYNKKNTNHIIRRILASGNATNGTITIDTEKMKTKHTINVEADVATNEVIPNSIFGEFSEILPSSYSIGS